MEHKKTADNKTALEGDIASRSEQLLKIPPPPPSYAPTLAPGERYLVKRGGIVVSLPSMRNKKKLRQSQV